MTKYKCHCCGQEHEDWPALIYTSPAQYSQLDDEEKENNGHLGNDFCIIYSEDQTDRFIRCTLTQKITDHCKDLEYGIWVSLSEKSYDDYYDNFENDHHLTEYFGWFCSSLNGYEDTLNIPTTVVTRSGNKRPNVIPDKDFDHPFVKDYYNGITKQEAERRINYMLKVTGQLEE